MAIQKITYPNKVRGDLYTTADATEVKQVVNNNANELELMGTRQESLAQRQTSVEGRMAANEGAAQQIAAHIQALNNDQASLSELLMALRTVIESAISTLGVLRGEVTGMKSKVSDVGQSQESGFYVADGNGNIGMKYDDGGLDVALLSSHLRGMIREIVGIESAISTLGVLRGEVTGVKSKVSDVGQSQESGFYVADGSGNVVLKYGADGLDAARLSSHLLSLIPNAKREIKILAIGNSYTVDAYTFLPYICESMGIELTLYFTFVGGSSLETNWNNYYNETIVTTYRYEGGVWLPSTGRKIGTLLSAHVWDYVVMQQVSTSSTDSASIQPWLGNFVDEITRQVPSASIGWLATPAYGTANGYSDIQRRGMFDGIWNVVNSKVLGSGVTVVIPECTAIENARQTNTLGSLGTRGQLNRDTIHLDYGIGRYVASLTVYMALIYPHSRKSVLGCGFRPIWGETVNTDSDQNSPARENVGTDVSATEALVAQKCAVAAYMRDEICDLSDF